ncbi:MAG: aminomethyl-transferring glycine dehydrogenase subunit GcvPB [Alphaproteobacteria bacterium]
MSTFTGNRGLDINEPLLFEIGCVDKTGVEIPGTTDFKSKLGGLERADPIGLPGLSEPETMRHFTRLSRKNFAIDMGIFPLGSCTMKHNPRLNEKIARTPGLSDVHPLQPISTVQGSLSVMQELSDWLVGLTGMPAVALSPKAGAHGELCGIMAIRAALEDKGDAREYILVPESAHGTNPATAALCGYKVKSIPANDKGRVDFDAFLTELDEMGETVAGIMLTNPNTCGLFEGDIIKIADAVHKIGAYFYCDGANFNAIVGKVRPGDLGIDAMHLNLHKTFSTPHGGGGPGSGPVMFSKALAPFVPVPYLVKDGSGITLKEAMDGKDKAFGRLTAFHGQNGMYLRALSYILSHGENGLKQVAEDAVLNANYILSSLEDVMTLSYPGPCMHEALFDDRFLKDTGVETLDFAKAMIDEGFHPMTMYFPLVVHGAMLIEPTETESKHALDQFIGSLRSLVEAAKSGDVDRFKQAPALAPMKRLDETRAARQPILRWKKSD